MTMHRPLSPVLAQPARPTPSSLALRTLLLLALALALGSCASSPEPRRGKKDLALEEQMRREAAQKRANTARNKDFDVVLIRIDKALSDYASNVSKSENIKAQRRATSLKKYLEVQSEHFERQLLEALGSDDLRLRSISAAALGFSNDQGVVEPLVNALEDRESLVRSNACLGIGQLASPNTPIGGLARIAKDDKRSIEERRAATWALFRIQTAVQPKGFAPQTSDDFAKIWPAILAGDTLDKDAILVILALRGLGLLRNPATFETAARYLSHPKALVRAAALIAVGRSRNRRAAALVLPFLSQSQTNPNVRLTARKTLKALTGNRVDHEYDVKAWRKEFADQLAKEENKDEGPRRN